MADIHPSDFRRAASHFITGVTVVTTLDEGAEPVGLTVNSFSTVSLDPPLVLFCLGRDSDTFAAFRQAVGYVIHVLGGDQMELATRFAAKGADRFQDLDWHPNPEGLPIVAGALARFECDLVSAYEGGDHVILVGGVRRLAYQGVEREALGYFRGSYLEVAGS